MGKMNENQKVNAEIFGFIAEFIIGLKKVKLKDEAIKLTENIIKDFKSRNNIENNDHVLRDLDFILSDLKGLPYSIIDNENREKYYSLLRKSI
ncbi:MAG: hypothetical protein ACOYOV_13880, partial [Bacteroidales bacterium]